MKTAQAAGAPAFNPYAAPAAAVADAAPAGGEALFFPVSGLKLALMSLGTLGLYEIYWSYKNWKCVQEHLGEKVNAPIRALFYPLTSYSLFKRIRERAGQSQLGEGLPAGPLALAVFLLGAMSRLPDPWYIASLLAFLPMLPVQSTVNELNRKLTPQADNNASFSAWNIAGLALGGILLSLALLGTFMAE